MNIPKSCIANTAIYIIPIKIVYRHVNQLNLNGKYILRNEFFVSQILSNKFSLTIYREKLATTHNM